MDFKNISDEYRAIPFWSWNEKLDESETERQIDIMKNAGIGGFFMHARGGLQTKYMGKEWFDNISVGVKRGKQLGMSVWAYDENGWPSGFGNGIVNGRGIAYQQKYLRMENCEEHTEHTICSRDGYHFYYDVNPFYVDTLNPDVADMFLEEIYEPYYNKYKNDIEGFFTDEPQISRNGIPWSFVMRDEYRKAYGEDLYDHLIELFENIGNYKNTRVKFWKLVTELFSRNFIKKLYDWCEERNLMLTGHLVLEETLEAQVTTNGAVMPHYEYFHIPGMDWLTKDMYSDLGQIQLGSAARQLGKQYVLTESFAMCGHNVSFSELKGLFEWQAIRGINILCPHLEGYSLRGIRKRDYPPAMYYQQPWWNEYKYFIEAMARIGEMIAMGKIECDILVISPQTSVWAAFNNSGNEGLEKISERFLETLKILDEKHVAYHIGDEILIERHAEIRGNRFIIGNCGYSKIILPCNEILFENTKRLLDEFVKNGGQIITVDDIESNMIINNPKITYTKRIFNDCTVHYFVNSTDTKQSAYISEGAKWLDIQSGELCEFDGNHTFEPFGSIVVIDDGSKRKPSIKKNLNILSLDGKWCIKNTSENALLLDFCDYYFDGVIQERNGFVLNIQHRACELRKEINLKQDYHVFIKNIPDSLYLITETPDMFSIWLNGKNVEKIDCGYYIDPSFRRINIQQYMIKGDNVITFKSKFKQNEKVYDNLRKATVFESEKNKITYDMEIEPIYLVGNFSVATNEGFEKIGRNAVRYNGTFAIDSAKSDISLRNIERQGYPFFCGNMKLTKNFCLRCTEYKLALNKSGINVVRLKVNDKQFKHLWGRNEIDISTALNIGENHIEIEIANNLRNILGPHHCAIPTKMDTEKLQKTE